MTTDNNMTADDKQSEGPVTIRIKTVYGRTLAYPANEAACLFAVLTGTTTLTGKTLKIIQQLGYTIKEDRGGWINIKEIE